MNDISARPGPEGSPEHGSPSGDAEAVGQRFSGREHSYAGHVLASLESVVASLATLTRSDRLPADARAAQIAQLDGDVRIAVGWAVRQSEIGVMPLLRRGSPWPGMASKVFGALLEACQSCLDSCAGSRADIAASVLSELRLRLVRAAADRIRWERYVGGPAHADLWAWAGIACRAEIEAQQRDFASVDEIPSVGSQEIEREYIRAVVNFSAAYEVLAPEIFPAVDRLVDLTLPQISLQREGVKDASCYLPFGLDAAPSRLVGFPDVCVGAWFLDTRGAREVLSFLRDELVRGLVPQELEALPDMGGRVWKALEHLLRHWSEAGSTRQSRRHAVQGALHAVQGFDALKRLLAGEDPKEPGQWYFQDVSRSGVGAWATPADRATVSVGDLVGIRASEGGVWQLGLVRRTWQESPAGIRVGLQTLSRAPVLGRVDDGCAASAVLVCDALVKGQTVRLIVPCGLVRLGAPLFFVGEQTILKLKPMQRGMTAEDFELWACQVL